MEGKKISFGFTKTKKVEKPVVAERKEYIECLEEKSIKVVGGEIVEEKAPLVIAMKPNTLITAERLKQIAEEVERDAEEAPAPGDNGAKETDSQAVDNETIEQMAVRELLNEAKQEKKEETAVLTVAVPSQPVLDGQKESTLEDYEAIPIQDFGMAMLRGMGWTASKEQQTKHKQPELRPKGLGLGADKVIKKNQKKNVSKDKKEEDLSIVKNSFVKITTGKYSGLYGKVVSLDEDNGRVMVDITIRKETVSLSEFMMQPVSKSEYEKQSKVINADSYEEYKKTENQKSNQNSKREERETSKRDDKEKEASSSKREEERDTERPRKDERSRDNDSNGRHKERKYRSRSRSNDRHRRKHKKRYSSNSSISSDDGKTKKREKYSCDSSESDDHRERRKSDKKRDIDKKRKGKKKKRDRDRSPNYRKHRK